MGTWKRIYFVRPSLSSAHHIPQEGPEHLRFVKELSNAGVRGNTSILGKLHGCPSLMIGGAADQLGCVASVGMEGCAPPGSLVVANDHGVRRNEMDGWPTKMYLYWGLGGSVG